MPNKNTFSVRPIGEFVQRHLAGISVDPFARNYSAADYTNDINPKTSADYHMDAVKFLELMADMGVVANTAIFDPPYSPRQISECYKQMGRKVTGVDTQNARLYKTARDAFDKIIPVGGIVLSFGWNTVGMGKTRGYEIIEIMLCCHGGAHNDTICMVEIKS
jgi:hypothetical protein